MAEKVFEDEAEFAEQLRALWESQNNQSSNEFKKELLAMQKRMNELDTLIRSLYESSVMGKIPERQFQRLMAQYDEEQTGCETRLAELKKELDNTETTKTDPQAAAEYEALLQKNRERCRQYAQKKKLAQQEPADKTTLKFEPTDELKGESA